jgi:hypothetical protein
MARLEKAILTANSPSSKPGDLNVQVEVVVAQAAANVEHLGMRTSRFR